MQETCRSKRQEELMASEDVPAELMVLSLNYTVL
jgi:hypothetical protein